MKKRIVALGLLFILCATSVFAQDAVSFRASAPPSVSMGRVFEVVYTLNKQPSAFTSPAFNDNGFNLIMGPSTEQYTNIVQVGNQMQQTTTFNYRYRLQPLKEGTFTIPGATCTIGGKNYQANAVTIKVEAGQAQQQQPQQQVQQQQPSRNPQQQQVQKLDDKSIFIRAIPSKSRVLRGEQVIITYKIYTEVPVSRFQISKLPANKGFWAEDLNSDVQKSQKTEYVNGREYAVADIRRVAVFPQESGNLTIEALPVEALVNVQVQRQQRRTGSPFDIFLDDPFFSGMGFGTDIQTVKKDLKSNPVSITVDPLPQSPDSFTGGVGSFDVESSVDREEMKANEALTYKIILKGQGNLMLINPPKISFPPDFEVYEPKVSSNLSRSEGGIGGSKTFEWILIPRNKGRYTIPAIDISFYDFKRQKYITQSTLPYTVKVNAGDANSVLAVTSASKEDIKLLNSDIDYIKIHSTRLKEKGYAFFRSTAFWLTLSAILILAIAAIGFLFYKEKANKNVVASRLRAATGIAKKHLKQAKKCLDEKNAEAFYIEIYQALWGYIGNKFGIAKANLSIETAQKMLEEREIKPEIIAQTIEVLHECEYARFAPGNGEDQMHKLYAAATQVITQIETSRTKQ